MKGKVETLTEEKFRDEAQQIIDSEVCFYLLQDPDSITLDNEKITLEEIEKYPSGRLFNSSKELKWKNGIYLKFYEDEEANSEGWDTGIDIDLYIWEDEPKIPYKWKNGKKPESIKAIEYKKNSMIEHLRFLEIIPGGK
ncbi:MAG: hypothetical protein ABRQ39_32505 [Candidatus Eremiobacterota bacterium]